MIEGGRHRRDDSLVGDSANEHPTRISPVSSWTPA